ncbi:MAG: TonB-dependent receptor [Caulobacter sp. 32-67-35]|nr:MAG: TonB-dependent receptor [Caulobacter sp. 32-67-35]
MVSAQPAGAQLVSAAAQTFDIPSQEASSALVQFCLQADCELAFTQQPGHSARTRPVRGRMRWREALAQMLKGTGLGYRFVGARGVRIWVEPPHTRPATTPPVEQAEGVEVEAVEVIGRPSAQIDETLRRKRQADVISDGVSTEQIGDLPAANLAEALQRVPGVAIEREVGEGQFVSVRGLGPLFQSVTLNGAPVAFNENIRNSTQSGRQFRFRDLSVDLLKGARLTKSATADLIDGGIGANIDIETSGGLDGDTFASVRVGGGLEGRIGEFRPDLSAAARIVSDDGARGLVAGLSHEQRSVRYDRFQIMRYSRLAVGDTVVDAPNDVRTTIESENRRRRSAFLGADWRVSPNLRLDFDALISTFDNAIREDRLVYGLGQRLAQTDTGLLIDQGVVVGARVATGRIDNNTEFSDQAHVNVATSIGAEVAAGDWILTPRLSISRAHSVLDTPLLRLSAQSPEGVAYDFDLGKAVSERKAARLTTGFDLLAPSSLTLAQLNVRAIESRDDDVTAFFDARRSLDRDLGEFRLSTVRLGGQFSDRSRNYQRRDRRASPRAAGAGVAHLYHATTSGDVFGDLLAVRSAPWVIADYDHLRAAFLIPGEGGGVMVRPDDLTPTGSDLQNSYRVGEQVTAIYARLDFEGQAAAWPFFGNVGLRLVESRTHVEGARMELVDGAATIRPVSFDGAHEILLPSLNMAFDVAEDAVVRLAVSRTMTRPSLADLRASTVPASSLVSAIYTDGQAAIDDAGPGLVFAGVGGNPALTPYVSDNIDFSYEVTRRWSSLSLAIFHKTVNDFIQTVEAPEILTFETLNGSPVQAEVRMARPRNLGRAVVNGLEIGVHRRLADQLGVWSSATWTHSRVGDRRLTGVSDWSWSVSPYVERGPLALNLSWSWRSAFTSEADLQGGGVSNFTVGAAGYLDAQVRYEIASNAQLVIAGSNLTDTHDLAYEGSKSRLLQLGSSGRSFSMRLNWRW